MREPVAGYPSKKHAVFALLAKGKTDQQILQIVGTTPGALSVYRKQFRRGVRYPSETLIGGEDAIIHRRAKAERIYQAALPIMAAGAGLSVVAFHTLARTLRIDDLPEPALPREQKVDEAEPARAGLVDTPSDHIVDVTEMVPETVIPASEPKPMMVMKLDKRPMDETSSAKFYTLRKSGRYLNLDGSGFTDSRHVAYRGSLAQARKMREANAWRSHAPSRHSRSPKSRRRHHVEQIRTSIHRRA